MKKLFYFVAVATLALVSCQKEVNPSSPDTNNTPCFKASIEQLVDSETKATINGSNQLVWATGDKIGIYFKSWKDNNHQSFTLSEGAGTTEGAFTKDFGWSYEPTDATVAYFPWRSGTNMSGDNLYFELPSEYWYYNNEDMVTPLVASISSSNTISFKHSGAAVKLTVNNLVSGTYKVKMTAYNKQITGFYHINPTNAGTEAMSLNDAENTSLNNITLNSWKSSGAFSWIFPVPALNDPKLKFEITDNNGILVWKKSLAAQTDQDLGRGDILVMPPISITPYSQFTQDNTTWTFSGTINGSSWHDNIPMMTDGHYWILSGFTFKNGDKFQIRKNKSWDEEVYPAKGESNTWNFTADINGAKDIIFEPTKDGDKIRVIDHSFPYPTITSTASISLSDNSFADWDLIPGSTNGITTVKAASDNSNLYVYFKRTSDSYYSEIWGKGGYVYVALETDGNTSNGQKAGDGSGPYDFFGYFYPYGSYVADPKSYTVALQEVGSSGPSPYTISNIEMRGSADDSAVEVELKIPRSDLPSIPSSSSTTVYVWGNKSMSKASVSRVL